MDVRYIAQLLLENSLLQVGLDRGLFVRLQSTGQHFNSPVTGHVGAILGGAISGAKSIDDFDKKLIGNKSKGFYLPGVLQHDRVPYAEKVRNLRLRALESVVGKATTWIREVLLPEMVSYDYTVLIAAMKETRGDDHVSYNDYNGYVWNAVGMFFRRGLYDNFEFAPAKRSMSNHKETLCYSVWDALGGLFEEKSDWLLTKPRREGGSIGEDRDGGEAGGAVEVARMELEEKGGKGGLAFGSNVESSGAL